MSEWRDVKGYEGIYQVSDDGQVRSVDRYVYMSDGKVQFRRGRLKSQFKNADGYMTVHLSNNRHDERKGVHILVAEAFVGGWFEGAEVNHIDFDRSNNNANNLEWLSHRDNVHYAINSGRHVCTRNLTGGNNPNYGNHTLSDKYMSDKELSKEKQSRPGKQNGRATAISASRDGKELRFDIIKDCAIYMMENGLTPAKNVNSVASCISMALHKGSKYLGFTYAAI